MDHKLTVEDIRLCMSAHRFFRFHHEVDREEETVPVAVVVPDT